MFHCKCTELKNIILRLKMHKRYHLLSLFDGYCMCGKIIQKWVKTSGPTVINQLMNFIAYS